MSDTTEGPELLVPDHRVLSLDDAREEEQRKKGRRSIGKDGDWMTRKDFNAAMTRTMGLLNERVTNGLAEGILAVGQKVYDQLADETQAHLQQQEQDIYERVLARIANERRERSVRRRARRLLARLGWREPAPALVAEAPSMEGEDAPADPDLDAEAIMLDAENAALAEAQRDG